MYFKRCDFHKKMNNHNLSLTNSETQVQRSDEQFPYRYYYLINHEVACDVKLLTDDGTVIFARKIDLVNASAYFYAMFNRYSEKDKDHVLLKELDSMALKLLVDYVYSDNIEITEENVKVLLSTADHLGFLFILNKCCTFLQDHLRPSNCLSIKAFADLYSCSTLLSSSELYIKQNILQVIECDEFLSISSERLEEVIKLISYVEQAVSNEKQVLVKCIMNWVNHEWYFRKGVLAELLEHIHLPLASKWCIINGVDMRYNNSSFWLVFTEIGGFDGNHELNEVEVFNVHTEEWKMVSSMSTSRGSVGVGVLNNLIYTIGGFDGLSRQYFRSVECYDPSFDRWKSIADMSTCRSSPGIGVLNGLMYAIGGHDGPFYHKSVEVYNPDTGLWSYVADMHVCRTNPGMGVIILHGLLYVLGGRSKFYDNVSSVEIYNPNTNTWEYMITASSNVGKVYGGVIVNKLPHFIIN
ncbi:kelch-like protein 2 [Melanaphis sacchari]|uniref:kelch-like protein 2 n=1 Tax=Melanaphis sacchari TaxID=742174 RepID=UPI000DC1333F|nr:kelch-like protein 2 [Melanaphis sacchari]